MARRGYEKDGPRGRYLEPWCERCGERPQTDALIVCAECAHETRGTPGDEDVRAGLNGRGVEDLRSEVFTWRADDRVCSVCGVPWSEHPKEAEYHAHLPARVEFGSVAQAREFVVKVMGVGRDPMTDERIERFGLELLNDAARRNHERETA